MVDVKNQECKPAFTGHHVSSVENRCFAGCLKIWQNVCRWHVFRWGHDKKCSYVQGHGLLTITSHFIQRQAESIPYLFFLLLKHALKLLLFSQSVWNLLLQPGEKIKAKNGVKPFMHPGSAWGMGIVAKDQCSTYLLEIYSCSISNLFSKSIFSWRTCHVKKEWEIIWDRCIPLSSSVMHMPIMGERAFFFFGNHLSQLVL